MRQALPQGNTLGKPLSHTVESCRNVSSQEFPRVQTGSTLGRTYIATGETQVASWPLDHHANFPLVALDLRQVEINHNSLLHVAAVFFIVDTVSIFFFLDERYLD